MPSSVEREGHWMEEREEQLKGEIHELQGQLAETLETLGEKASPKQLKEDAKAKVRDKVDDVADKVSPPRIVRRQVEKVKDKLGDDEPDEVGPTPVDKATRERIAEAAREIDGRDGPVR